MVTVQTVCEGSYAARAGIIENDILISVNGNAINDVLDYRFYIMDKRLTLALTRNGMPFESVIEKEEYEDIGLEFSTYLMDEKKRCRNNCIFCFIDQNPMGMRETVYFKDDDERLSFLMGNYVTLTNLKRSDIDRIVKMRISPVNISVHTTDAKLRCKMMNNRFAGECLDYIRILDEGGIAINAQLVLCNGINDGAYLEKSLTDLLALENIESIALVPCGLTGHRKGLYPLKPYDKATASAVLDIANKFGESALKDKGMRLVYPSDEFYLLAEREIPNGDYYEGYPQLENGVGMIRSDSDEFAECLENNEKIEYNREVSIATGYAAYEFIKGLALDAMKKHTGLRLNVFPIRNDFFGGSVTVSGLVTGGDIINQLSGKRLGSELLIPENMLRAEGDMFLDNVTVEELESALSVKVTVVSRGGYARCEAMLGTENP